jgi:hypothetical protein
MNNLLVPSSPAECDQDDFENVKFWMKAKWTGFKKDQSDRGDRDVGKLGFLTDEDGSMVSKDRLQEMSTKAWTLFNELYRYSHDPPTWGSRGKTASAFFSNCMCQKFPEFCWCESDWKVHAFAMARYPNWVTDVHEKGLLTCILLVSSVFFLLNADKFVQGLQQLSDFATTSKRKIDDSNGPRNENRGQEKKEEEETH